MNKFIVLSLIAVLVGAFPVYATDSNNADPLEQLQDKDPQIYEAIKSLEAQLMQDPSQIFELLQSEDIQNQIVVILQNENVRTEIMNLMQDPEIKDQINSLMENPEVQNQINLLMQNENLKNEVYEIINSISNP